MLISFFSVCIEFIYISYAAKTSLSLTKKPTRADLLFLLLLFAISDPFSSEISLSTGFYTWVWLTENLIYLVYCYILCSGKWLNCLYLFGTIMSFLIIVQIFATFILSFFPVSITQNAMSIAGNMLTLFITMFLFRLDFIKKFYANILLSHSPYRLIFLNTYLTLTCILFFGKSQQISFFLNISSAVLIALFLISINFAVLYYDQKIHAGERELENYQKNLPIYRSLLVEIRSSQHEYSNHLQSLRNLPEICQDYESLKNALQQYTNQYATNLHMYPLLRIDKPLLAASLYSMCLRAEQIGITVQLQVTSEKIESAANEIQLSDFVNILFQNAIEASQSGDWLYVQLHSENGKTEFEIRNPVSRFYTPQELSAFFQRHYTTKVTDFKSGSTPHGAGLYTLLHTVNKQKGVVGADCIPLDGQNWMIFRFRV